MKDRTILAIGVGLIAVGFLASCSKKEVSFDTTETARSQAKANALWNAQAYMGQDPRVQDLQIYSRGDSTQTPACPQGDGWASVDYMDPSGTHAVKFKAKCSTVSRALGCMMESDFMKKPEYKTMEGNCQSTNKVPFPLPKIAQ
jgi:hypothetical protein